MGELWCDDANPTWDWYHMEFRIKKEHTYRPYKDVNEMLEDITKRHVNIQNAVFDGIWLKRTDCEVAEMITGMDHGNSYVLIGTNWLSLGSVFFQYTYLDGTPFGIKELKND